MKAGMGYGRRVGAGWKRDGRQEAALVLGIPLPTDLRLNSLVGPVRQRRQGPPGTRARLEGKAGWRSYEAYKPFSEQQ